MMDVYNNIWAVGWILVIITRIMLCWVNHDREAIEDKPIPYQIVVITLMCACISIVGGIANAFWLGGFLGSVELGFWGTVLTIALVGFLPAVLTYLVGFGVLGLYKEERDGIHAIFIVTFIVSIILWTIPITKYNKNIEYKETTGISSTVDHELYYFCNIPVQQVSGSISGSSFLGNGSVSGSISTLEELPYWYDNGSGEGLYASVSADDSKIVFIEDGESPFVRIITHCKQEIKIDNNTGEESIEEETYWKTYEFYLPEEVMQYNVG